MISRNVSFADFLQSKRELMKAISEQQNFIQIEKRDVAHYARFVLLDESGLKYPLNVTPSHRIELFWEHTDSFEPTLSKIALIREGQEIGSVNPEHIQNKEKFKHWLIQHTYCYFD